MVSYKNGVSIGEIVVYIPVLAIAVILAIRHGFGRNSGWIFLVIFSLARIIGPSFQLATIHDPTNTDLYTGAAILQSVGLSPLILAALGLLSRVVTSISKVQRTFPGTKHLKAVQFIVTVGLLLGIMGGIDASDKLKSTGRYEPKSKSKFSVALFIIAYVLLVLSVLLTSSKVSHAEPGEKRILFAVGFSLPFLFVRLIYSSLSTFDSHSTTFNQVSGNVTVWLFMSLAMEFIVVIIFEVMGITLKKVETYERPDGVAGATMQSLDGQAQPEAAYGYSGQAEGQQPYYGNAPPQKSYHGNAPPAAQGPPPAGSRAPSKGNGILKTLGQRTIIGRIVTSARGNGDDVEMQQQHQQQPQNPYEWR